MSYTSFVLRCGVALAITILFYVGRRYEQTPDPKFSFAGFVLFGFGVGVFLAFTDALYPRKIGLTRSVIIVSDLWCFHQRETTYLFEHITVVKIEVDTSGRRVMRLKLTNGYDVSLGLPGTEATAVKALDHLRRWHVALDADAA